MDFKCILFTLALCMNLSSKRRVQGEFVDIVLQIYDFTSNYTRFINVTERQYKWLSSVLCDNNTYSYSINYHRDNGSVISNRSTTFMAQNINTAIYLTEFVCNMASTEFQCTRRQNNQNCQESWIYLRTDTKSTCQDKCVILCPINLVQSILIRYDRQTFKIPNNAVCQNAIPYQTSTLDSLLTLQSLSTLKSQSTLKSDLNFMSDNSSLPSPDNCKRTSPDDSLPVIIGASVGGGVLFIIAIILFLVCLKKRQKRNQQKNPQQKEHNNDNIKGNGINNNNQQNLTEEDNPKTCVTDLAKAKSVNKRVANIYGTETCGSSNLNVNIATYSCVDIDDPEPVEKNDNIPTINAHQRQCQPFECSNPAFSGSCVDYSSINEVHNELNHNSNNNDVIYTSESFRNSGNTYSTLGQNTRSLLADTYSTLGEKTRSLSDTYNVMPAVSNKKGHKSLGANSDSENNRGNASNKNLGDKIWKEDDAPNDVYAQVIKPMRKVH